MMFSANQVGQLICDVAIHELEGGDNHLLQSTRNASGLQSESRRHLQCRLRLRQGARHMLIGRNGCGKSTLLRAIASGRLEGWPSEISMHLVTSESSVDLNQSILENVLMADRRTYALRKKISKLEMDLEALGDEAEIEAAGLRLNELYEELEELGADDEEVWHRNAEVILAGLGFSAHQMNSMVQTLSGGWQIRVALAAALFAQPDLLLMDEPTNHLDLPTVDWLSDYLTRRYRGTVLCVSHNRFFINEVATEVMVFSDRTLESYVGNLDDYERQACQLASKTERQVEALDRRKAHKLSSIKKMEEKVEKTRRNEEAHKESRRFVKLGGVGCNARETTQSDQVKQGLKKLERMGLEKTADGKRYGAKNMEWTGFVARDARIGAAEGNDGGWVDGQMTAAPIIQSGDAEFAFSFPEPEELGLAEGAPMLQLSGAGYSYVESTTEDAVLLDVDLSLLPRSRVALTGRNGSGKSTLVALITGEANPTWGEVHRHGNLRVAHFSQHHAELLPSLAATPLAYMQKCLPKAKDHELLDQLDAVGVDATLASLPLDALSGGQRVRVSLARLCAEDPHLLVLDEPTNHLDIYSIDALAAALRDFAGAVVLVTHDRGLLEDVAEEVLIVTDRGVTRDTNYLPRFIPAYT